MSADLRHVQDIRDLRRLVNETICQHNALEPGSFEMTERVFVRGNKPYGMFFCLHGPRSVRFIAIWELDRNTVLFYGSNGERQRRMRLSQKLRLIDPAEAPEH